MATNFDLFLPYSGETVTQAQWQDYINALGADGVTTQLNGTSALAVTQHGAGAMSVDVAAGRLLVQGMRAENSTTKTLTIANNASGNPRIDVVVARFVAATPAFVLDVLQGTPAGSPTAPALTQTSATYEVALANIAVANGAVSILTANITDQRAWSGPAAVRIPSVASAAALNVNFYTGNPTIVLVPVTGTTTITSINTAPAGSVVVLEFASANCAVTNAGTLKLSAAYTSTASSTLTLYSDGTNWLEIGRSVAPATQPAGVQNALVNGDFPAWQRGTTFTNPADSAFLADRWQQRNAIGTAQLTWAQDTTVPTVAANAINTPYVLKMSIPATADASIGATDLYGVFQDIEGFDYRPLTSAGFSLSFWVKAHRTGTYCVAFSNTIDRSYVTEYTVNSADTWQYVTITVPTPPTAGTWNYTTGKGLRVFFALAVGANFQTTANAWNSVAAYGTANNVNGVGATTDVFSLALVNLVPGATAYPVNPVPYAKELVRCQRYAAQLFPGTAVHRYGAGFCQSTTAAQVTIPLPVPMNKAPTATYAAAANFQVFSGPGLVACTVIATSLASATMLGVQATVAAGLTVGQGAILCDVAAGSSLLVEANP